MDYEEAGRQLIIDTAQDQIDIVKAADQVKWTTQNGSAHLFEIALNMIGQSELSSFFTQTRIDLDNIVMRIDSQEHVLTAVISCIEKNDYINARKIAQLERDLFYIPGFGYCNPHMYKMFTVSKHSGLSEKDSKQKHWEYDKRRFTREVNDGITEESFFSRYLREARYTVFSLPESIYAMNIGAALSSNHGLAIPEDVIAFEYKNDLGSIDYHTLFRSLDLLGDPRAKGLFKEKKEALISEIEKEEKSDALLDYAFLFDHFGEEDVSLIRSKLLGHIKKIRLDRETGRALDYDSKQVEFGRDKSYNNAQLIRIGLALVGLDKSSPMRYYTP